MQQEYPDSVRESAQLFSFKSDKTIAKAWENSRFEHLKGRWTYRELDGMAQEKENIGTGQRKRISLSRMLSTPSLRTIGERSPPPMINRRQSSIEDPFTTNASMFNTGIDMAELSATLDRIQMMMNQTNLRINALADKQQTYMDNLDRLQSAIEENAHSIQALTIQHQAGAQSTRNIRSSIDQTATQLKSVLQKQESDSEATAQIQRTAKEMTNRIDEMASAQRASAGDTRATRSTAEHTAGQVQTILDRQRQSDERLKAIQTAIDGVATARSPRPQTVDPNTETLGKLSQTVEQHSETLATLVSGQKSGNRAVAKTNSAIAQLTADQTTLKEVVERQSVSVATILSGQNTKDKTAARAQSTMEQLALDQEASRKNTDRLRSSLAHVTTDQQTLISSVRQVQKTTEQSEIAMKQQTDNLNARIDLQTTTLESQIARSQATNDERLRDMMAMCQRIMDRLDSPGRRNACDHDIIPPPRKMNRKLIGYVYSRNGT